MFKKVITTILTVASIAACFAFTTPDNARAWYSIPGCYYHEFGHYYSTVYQAIGIRYLANGKREGLIKQTDTVYCSECFGVVSQDVTYFYLSEKECKDRYGINLDNVLR